MTDATGRRPGNAWRSPGSQPQPLFPDRFMKVSTDICALHKRSAKADGRQTSEPADLKAEGWDFRLVALAMQARQPGFAPGEREQPEVLAIRSKANRMAPAPSRATRRREIAALAAREPGGLRPPRFAARPIGIAKLKDAPAGKRRAPVRGVFREWPSWRRLRISECECTGHVQVYD
jgi:hypothetical protein